MPESIYNATDREIVVLSRKDVSLITKFQPEDKTRQLAGLQVYSDQPELEPIFNGLIPVKELPSYVADPEEWERANYQKGDTVIVSIIGYQQYKDLAAEKGVRLIVPGYGPNQCLKVGKEMVGIYEFMSLK